MSLKGDFAKVGDVESLATGIQAPTTLSPEGMACVRGFDEIAKGQNDSIDRELINKTVREWGDIEKNMENFAKRDHVAEANMTAMRKENSR